MARASDVVIITGAFPTDSPTTLGATNVAESFALPGKGVDFSVIYTAGTGEIVLIGWQNRSGSAGTGGWIPILEGDGSSAIDGGVLSGTSNPDPRKFTHFALWEKSTVGAVYAPVTKGRIYQED